MDAGATRVHLIAHSMGNRALLDALPLYLAKRTPDKPGSPLGQIVFTAPDVDRDLFVDAVPGIVGAAERLTLYASNNDKALRTSELLHGAPRAGLAGNRLITLRGLDSIDMSSIEADLMGHSYFADNTGAMYDLFRLLWRGDPPPRRCGMVGAAATPASQGWKFNVQDCSGQEILLGRRAVQALRQPRLRAGARTPFRGQGAGAEGRMEPDPLAPRLRAAYRASRSDGPSSRAAVLRPLAAGP